MIRTFPNFLTADECRTFTSVCGPNASQFTNSGKFDNKKWHDPVLAAHFFQRLIAINKCEQMLRANTVIIHYKSGDSFNLHTDTGLYYDRESQTKSRWTLLIYLNDDFDGGQTEFFDDSWVLTRTIEPVAGTALLFDINLWHRGTEVTKGEKHWIGCEIIGAF